MADCSVVISHSQQARGLPVCLFGCAARLKTEYERLPTLPDSCSLEQHEDISFHARTIMLENPLAHSSFSTLHAGQTSTESSNIAILVSCVALA